MYTYVFDDKENEIALNNIKAIIFDVISREKAKQAVFREQVMNVSDANAQNELFSIANVQEAGLNDFIFVGNQLGEILKKIDSYSRNFNLSNNNVNDSQNKNGQSLSNNLNTVANESMDFGSVSNENVSVPISPEMPVDDSAVVDEVPDVKKEESVAEKTDEVAVEKDDKVSEDDIFEDAVDEQKEIPASDEKVVEESEKPVEEDSNSPDESVDLEKAGEEPEENINSGVQLVIPGANSSATEEKSDDTNSELIPINEEENNGDSTKLIIPMVEDEKNVEKTEESAPVNIVNNPPQVIPDVNSDPMIDALLASDDIKEEKQDEAKIVFKKRGNDLARAILTNAKQTAHLRKSLSTQEALLSSRGFFENINSANLEQKLVDNGLLPASDDAQMETMLNQANALYAEGKLEEAQAIFDKISELNKQKQAGTAMAA